MALKTLFEGLDEAIIVARNGQPIITGVYVTPLSPPASSEQKAYIKKVLLKNANEFMEKAKKICAQNGILFYQKILHGDEGPKIVKFAHDKNFDLIVIGSRGMGSLKEMFLGSTSNYVLHKAKIPVLIVK
jgi:nucleotide-binding universal stress UspA family protein